MGASEPRWLGALAEVRDAQAGEVATAFAVLRRVERRQTKTGKPFVDLVLADASGEVAAKIWDDRADAMDAALGLTPGTAVKVRFEIDRYRDAPQLRVLKIRPATTDDDHFDRRALYGDVPEWLAALTCRTLVFDIETVPDRGIRDMPPTIVKALTEHAERTERDESAVRGLSPFFGKVVSLAFGDGDADGVDGIHALVVPRADDPVDAFPAWLHAVDEPELLRCFWSLAAAAETVVSYNGRGFDVPFLVARSLVHGVPARVDLLSQRFALRPHLDLFEIVGQRGRGPSNLDVVCWALGIESPKGAMDGSLVAPAYESGRIADIAVYNRHDVRATAAVFRRVRDLVLAHRTDWS
ncbi:MAG: ribonuclease H-like domain-containing protein [Planctomycetes bacterium]|nr:ribonuclease H-like domain-containing protein [Planctomycetota bacterium]